MSTTEEPTSTVTTDEALRTILKSQYHAALDMLGDAIEKCPDEIWDDTDHRNEFWQIAYHTLYFTHLYLCPTDDDFRPWHGHQANVQYDDAIPGPPDQHSNMPLLPEPYTKEQMLEYWKLCKGMVDETVNTMDIHSHESGFSWYPIPKLEHQIVNLRHIQHGAAQLADRVRAGADIGVSWAGARRPSP